MRVVDIINKKVEKKPLTKEEIFFIVNEYVANNIPDYQISALLMAIRLNNMNDEETAYLTEAMMNSGEVINWDFLHRTIVDKHSTGGVGDKVSIVLCPLLASLGLTIAKMSGRGLGHTGGTLDKLESIKGFNVFLSEKQFKENVEKYNIAIIGQNEKLVPADKKLYALRDVTGTVQSMPLIASSIMSKKLATGSNCILLDVKCGNGAFMKNINDAKKLGNLMISIGRKLNRNIAVEITNMEQPLGRTIGNKIEILEAIDTLKGKGPIKKAIDSNKAYEKFLEWIKSQNGDISIFDNPNWFNPKFKYEVKSKNEGYLKINSAIAFGLVAMKLGAGRKSKEDSIDYEAGIYLNKTSNDYVKKNDVLFTLYSSKPIDSSYENELLEAIEFAQKPHLIESVFAKLS